MKGLIFTEFLELVEEKFGLEMVDQIIQQSELSSNGVYTAVGTYEFSDLVQLLGNLSKNTGIDANQLLLVYAEHLFQVLIRTHPRLIEQYKDPMDLMASIENHIHVEVQKIYPQAQLPTFEIEERTADKMVMLYKSDKGLYVLAYGLMLEAFKLFNTAVDIAYNKLNEQGTLVRFEVNKV